MILQRLIIGGSSTREAKAREKKEKLMFLESSKSPGKFFSMKPALQIKLSDPQSRKR